MVKKLKEPTKKQKIGNLGEDVVCRFLMKHGFSILERNYWKKWGEIDIIAKKSGKVYFVEVKTVSCENIKNVLRETDRYRPEDNIHPNKLKRLGRTLQSYLLEKDIEDDDWQLDGAIVYLDTKNREAKVRIIEDIII